VISILASLFLEHTIYTLRTQLAEGISCIKAIQWDNDAFSLILHQHYQCCVKSNTHRRRWWWRNSNNGSSSSISNNNQYNNVTDIAQICNSCTCVYIVLVLNGIFSVYFWQWSAKCLLTAEWLHDTPFHMTGTWMEKFWSPIVLVHGMMSSRVSSGDGSQHCCYHIKACINPHFYASHVVKKSQMAEVC